MALENKIDEIIELFTQGKTYSYIAEILHVPLTTLHDFTSKPENSARVREARRCSALEYAGKAEKVLIEAEGTIPEIQRAKELAQHYRWEAKMRNPRDFGDKLDVEHSGEGMKIKVVIDKTK